MPKRRPVTLFRSVRFRIAGWNTLAVAIAVTLSLVGLRQSVRWALLHEVDQVLHEDAREVGLALVEAPAGGIEAVADGLRRKAAGHKQHRWFGRLTGPAGAVVFQSDGAERAPRAEPNARARTVGVTRTLCEPAPPNRLGVAAIQVGSSLELVNADLARIDRLVALSAAAVLLASPLCGYWLAGIATRDLERLTETAATLRPTRLEERLPYRGVDDEFDRLAFTINRLLDRIAQFVDEKRSFLADAAHELRTPIAALRSSVEVALTSDRSGEDYRTLLERVLDQSESLEVLVSQVLLLSEASAQLERTEHETVSLSDVATRSVDMFRAVAETRGLELSTSIKPGVQAPGVRRHLAQVVNNLLDNAIKYTPSGGRVCVVVDGDDAWARLEVSDTGQGISEADLPHVFERFWRADRARSRDDVPGTGLGLCICKTIVEAHRGVVTCRSRLGGGSTFEVRLPAAG